MSQEQGKKPIPGKEKYNKVKEIAMKRPWLTIAILIFPLLLLSAQFREALIILGLVTGSAISKVPQAFIPFVINIDLTVFLLVLGVMAYSPGTGILLALVAYYIGTILRAQISNVASETYVGPPAGLIVTGLIIGILPFGIFVNGMIATLLYSAMMMSFYWVLYRNMFNEVTFIVTIIPMNYWLFSTFGEKLLTMLA